MKRRTIEYIVGLKEDINNIFSEKHSLPIVEYYSNKFDIPLDISSLYIKQRISRCFIMKSNKFDRKLDNSYIIVSIIKYLSFLIYTLLLSSRRNAIEPNNFELLIEGIQSKSEIDRWLKLEREFNIDNTIFLARNDMDSVIKSKHNIFVYKTMCNYERKFLIRLLFKSFFYDIFFLVKNSFNLGINLIHIHTLYVNDYLYYSNVFKECRAKFMIQDRNLGMTNALKNYLFKKSGGVVTSCIQKNIVQYNGNALFYDTDVFFSYGNKTAEDILTLGARIDKVFPVGSLAMDVLSSVSECKPDVEAKQGGSIDILYIGINAITSDKTNWSGYYESIVWLAKLSNDLVNLKVVIKHHPSWIPDKKEYEIIKDTNVEYLDKNLDSYSAAHSSKIIMTYGSSMGYELMGCGLNVIFVDPLNENTFINNFVHDDNIVVYNFEDLKSLMHSPKNFKQTLHMSENADYCYSQDGVSSRIYNFLISSTPKDIT